METEEHQRAFGARNRMTLKAKAAVMAIEDEEGQRSIHVIGDRARVGELCDAMYKALRRRPRIRHGGLTARTVVITVQKSSSKNR